jgi:zinc/manganese transport system substrate-binding protein
MLRNVMLALALATGAGVAAPAQASVRVVSSIPTLGSLAKEVGGDRVEVVSLGKGYQDPHFVEPKPSLMVDLNKADLLVYVGLDLEIGWLPPLVLGSRNPKIQNGELGSLDCSRAIPVLDVPTTKVDRSMGDIHPQGNPHYWIPPGNAKVIAREIAARLKQIDPQGAATYDKRLADFNARVDAAEKSWQPLVEKARGRKIVTYHKSWTYVSAWLGFTEIGYLEPKPGIPPDPQHLLSLIQTMRADGVKLLLVEDFYNRNTAQLVASKAGAKMLTLPTDVGATPDIKTWFDLVNAILKQLATASA